MKYLTGLLLPLLFSSNLLASDLCDSSCDLSITFPDGGSIEAVKDIEIEFGTGGYITNNGVTTGYSKGDDLELDSGESLRLQDFISLEDLERTGGNQEPKISNPAGIGIPFFGQGAQKLVTFVIIGRIPARVEGGLSLESLKGPHSNPKRSLFPGGVHIMTEEYNAEEAVHGPNLGVVIHVSHFNRDKTAVGEEAG